MAAEEGFKPGQNQHHSNVNIASRGNGGVSQNHIFESLTTKQTKDYSGLGVTRVKVKVFQGATPADANWKNSIALVFDAPSTALEDAWLADSSGDTEISVVLDGESEIYEFPEPIIGVAALRLKGGNDLDVILEAS